jgi:hypothetical protein
VTPVIRSDAADRTVVYGSTVSTTWTAYAGGRVAGNRPVRLCVALGAAPAFTCSPAATGANGTVAARRTVTAPYRVKLVVPAGASTNAVSSATAGVSVRSLARLAVRSSTTLTATLTGVAGQTVRIERWTGTRWTTDRTYRAVAAYTVTVSRGHRYRMVVPATPLIAGSASTPVTP